MAIDYIETWKEIIQKPSNLYREMPKTGGYFDPVVFATVSAAISMLIRLLFTPETDEIRTFISDAGFSGFTSFISLLWR